MQHVWNTEGIKHRHDLSEIPQATHPDPESNTIGSQGLECIDAYINLVMSLTILKLNGIDDRWTGAPVPIELCGQSPRSMLKQLGTESAWCQSEHGEILLASRVGSLAWTQIVVLK